jgi:molybdopterin converting factor small subunit
MKVIFFGKFADSLGEEIDFELPSPCTVADFRAQLDRAFPGKGFADLRVRACIAGAITGDDALVSNDQAIEILAPVSGG